MPGPDLKSARKSDGLGLRARAISRVVSWTWSGTLIEKGNPAPIWTCQHQHESRETAGACASEEAQRRGEAGLGLRPRQVSRPVQALYRGVIHEPGRGSEPIWTCSCEPEHTTVEEARLCAEGEIVRIGMARREAAEAHRR